MPGTPAMASQNSGAITPSLRFSANVSKAADEISFGIYACSPEESSFTALFSDMKITEPVKLEDYGILASTDPVALDQACIDIINQQKVTAKNDPTDLLKRIDKQHGTHTIDHAAQIGLGSKKYELINLDL